MNQLQLLNLIAVLVSKLGGKVAVSAQELVDLEHHSVKTSETDTGLLLVVYKL